MRTISNCMGARSAGYRLANWMARRAANVALSSLDEHMLKDMGLSRNAIDLAMDATGCASRSGGCRYRRS